MTPAQEARTAVIFTALRMQAIMRWLVANHADIPAGPALYIGVLMVSAARYCNVVIQTIENPAVQQPMLGRRCMFY